MAVYVKMAAVFQETRAFQRRRNKREKVRWVGVGRNIHQAPYATSSAHKFSTFFAESFSAPNRRRIFFCVCMIDADITQKFPETFFVECTPSSYDILFPKKKSFKNAFSIQALAYEYVDVECSQCITKQFMHFVNIILQQTIVEIEQMSFFSVSVQRLHCQ